MAAKKKKKRSGTGLVQVILGDRRNGDISLSFFAYVMILLVVGLVMMSSASYAWAYSEKNGDGLYYARNQLINAGIGFAAMLVFMKIDYHNFKLIRLPFLKKFNIASLMYLAGAVLLLLTLAIGNDEGGNMGAKRWLDIGPIGFQPSELAKFTLIIFFAYSMEKDAAKMDRFGTGIIKYGLFLALYAGLIILEPHLSGTILVCVIAAALIICGGANKKYLIPLAVAGVTLFYAYIKWQMGIEGSYIAKRIKSFQDPFADVLNDTWQTANSLIAIGSGGVFGLGLGNSRQKYLYLPETKNDFVFPIVCEELGFVGAVAIIRAFAAFIVRGYWIAARIPDTFGKLLTVGITTQIAIQTVINMWVVTGLMPITGASLPFFSYGGTSLLILLCEVGVILGVSRHIPVVKQG